MAANQILLSTAAVCAQPDARARTATGVGSAAAFALAGLSGFAYAAAFPPLAWPIAAWVALVPLLVACAALSPLRAFGAGLLWTATASLGVAWFFPDTLVHYFGLGPVASRLAAIVYVGGFHGVWFAAYAAWVAWLVRRGAANPWLLAGGWLACEVARSQGATGAPWVLLAFSQSHWTPVIQIADLAGPYGIGLVVAAVNAMLAACLVPALRGRRPRVAAVTIATVLVGTLGYGAWRLGEAFGDGDPVAVAVVQGGAAPADPAGRPARLARYVDLSGFAPHADLVIWPEHALDAYVQEAGPTRDAVLALSRTIGADLVVGGPHWTPAASGARYHNSAFLVRDGRIVARYDKRRLVPVAEDGRLSWLLGARATRYTPGRGGFVLPATGLRIGTLLCLEAMYPSLVRRAVDDGADVLVNLSNDAWIGHPEAARLQLDVATLRAVESRRWLVRAASTGISAVVDPHGRTLAESGFETHQVLHSTVRMSRIRSPYQRWGDAFAWIVITATAGMTLAAAHPSRRSSP
jgi:apolipoprotein N-acyltransferase